MRGFYKILCFRDKNVLYRVGFLDRIENKKSLKSLDFLGFFAGKEGKSNKKNGVFSVVKTYFDSFKKAMDGG